MLISFSKNKKLININACNNICIYIIINNSDYIYQGNFRCSYELFYKTSYKYLKCFDLMINSYYKIEKSEIIKKRYLSTNLSCYTFYLFYNTFYSYFIFNKFYKYLTRKEYHNIANFHYYTIASAKKFNCRDYYRIYSFI